MGYGFGGFLLVVGLVLALAVTDKVDGVDLTMVGWIMAAVGAGVVLLAVFTNNGGRRARNTQTVTHPDGSQTTVENRSQS